MRGKASIPAPTLQSPEGKANRRHHLQCCNELRPRNKEPKPILKLNFLLKKVFSRLLYCRLGKTHRTKFRGQLCLQKKCKFTNRSGETLANVAIHPSKLQRSPWDLEELQVEFLTSEIDQQNEEIRDKSNLHELQHPVLLKWSLT